ncbi:MAG: gliding motility-associated C-terminal domain-containing protein, partial [Bacteroidota bacterium]
QELVVALDTDTIQSNVAAWTTLGTCYRATGEEDLIVIGNQKLLSEVEFDCFNESENNFSYTHFDDIIVAPFDLVPDTLNLCEGTPIEWDASFYDLPIRWSDGWTGPQREFTAGGWYQIFGDTGDCELRDDVFVVEIPEIYPVFEQILCSNSTVELVVPYPPAVWSTGEEASSLIVNQPGTYTADFETPCGTRQQTFTVTEQRCELTYYVPNVFSPNRDGVNDKLEFFFRANGDFQGELHLFDRWGNLVYQKAVNSTDPPPSWDGRFRNRELPAGVYLWFFRYEIGINETSNIITGDATLIR